MGRIETRRTGASRDGKLTDYVDRFTTLAIGINLRPRLGMGPAPSTVAARYAHNANVIAPPTQS